MCVCKKNKKPRRWLDATGFFSLAGPWLFQDFSQLARWGQEVIPENILDSQ